MKLIIECSIGNTLPKDAEPTEAAEDYGCTACEFIKDNKIHRCSKFVFLAGKNPQTSEVFTEEGKCIDSWQPILMLEMSQTNRGQTQALESFRNETVKGQSEFNQLVSKSQLMIEVD